MRKSLQEYCVENNMKYLLDEWDQEKNMDITPASISFGSNKKVWWKCAKGHQWQTKVDTRVNGTGCPICTNHVVASGINDLQTMHPDLADQWHPTLNGELTPEQVLPGSSKKVWWQCGKGHEWQAQIKSRVGGSECPVCTNRVVSPGENDLGTTHPELAKQWHPAKNGDLLPRDVSAGSDKRVWWRCEKEHEWEAKVYTRAGGARGCPVCANKVIVPGVNDFASAFPAIAKQWHPTKNGDLTPESVAPYSNLRVWWQCDLGHEWQTMVTQRTNRKNECPYCTGRKVLAGFNDLGTKLPGLAAQWHPTLNGELTPDKVSLGSQKRVWWQCELGHVWKSVIHSRALGRRAGCPVCAGKVKGTFQGRYSEALKED